MIIPHPVAKLEYNPSSDILMVEWPNFTHYTLSEAKYTLEAILETIRTYDVKYLLLDTRKGALKIDESLYKQIKLSFIAGLSQTRLNKFARVVSKETLRQQLIEEVVREAGFVGFVKNFDNSEDAYKWLCSQ